MGAATEGKDVGRGPAVGAVVALAAAVAVVAAGLTVGVLAHLDRPAGPPLPWWGLAVGWGVTEVFLVHFQHRRESHSLSLSAIPLVVGLFTLDPLALLAARLVGSALALVVFRRQAPVKLAVNAASFWLETAVAAAVFHALAPADLGGITVWFAAAAAALVSDQVQQLVIVGAISLYQRRLAWSSGAALLGPAAALADTSLALVAVTLLREEPAALALLATLIPLLYGSYRAHTRLREEHRNLAQLYELTSHSQHAASGERVAPTLVAQARELMRAEAAWLCTADEAGPVEVAAEGAPVRPQELDALLVATAHAAGRPVLVPAGAGEVGTALLEAGLREAVAAPLVAKGGLVGALIVADRSGDARRFSEQDLQLLATVANHVCVSLENSDLVRRLRCEAAENEHKSLHDPLTGLPNRTFFSRQLAEAVAVGPSGAVLLLDLDGFKEVNDSLGHHCGDVLLTRLAERLVDVVGAAGTVARLGGDEFAVILPAADAASADVMARRILAALKPAIAVMDVSLAVGGSIGIALSPEHGHDAATLLQRADVAMYNAKRDHSGVELYSEARDRHSPDRLAIVDELRDAIEHGRLAVHYQPQVDLASGRVVGVEALVRWPHARRGFVGPDVFVPVAERTGLIGPLTSMVLAEALAQCAAWRAFGWDLRMSVNLSARSLLQPALLDEVVRLLDDAALPADALCLELTETSVMTDPARTLSVLERLAATGVTVAVDDFGTGYSSLAYLTTLPVGEIKIDKGFIQSMHERPSDAAVVRSVVDLAKNLGLPVVAEGVETRQAEATLRAMGCGFGQGYLYSRPLPGAEMTDWIMTNRVATVEGAPSAGQRPALVAPGPAR